MKLIPLSKNGRKNKGKYFAMVDDENFEILNQFSWSAMRCSDIWYAVHSKAAPRTIPNKQGKTTVTYMHRLIMAASAGEEVDHINHNGIDNQKNNLRKCTGAQNIKNYTKSKNKKSSIYKGVSYYKRVKKWQASICCDNKPTWLGHFKTEVEAAIAYNEAAKRLHGEFAHLNIIEQAVLTLPSEPLSV